MLAWMLARLFEIALGGVLLVPTLFMPSEIQSWFRESARSWSCLDGQIVESQVNTEASGVPREGHDYCVSISYRYSVEGKSFHGSAHVLDDNSRDRITGLSGDLKAGETIAVYYNIFKPWQSRLRRPSSVSPAYVLSVLVTVLSLGIYGFLLIIGKAHIDMQYAF